MPGFTSTPGLASVPVMAQAPGSGVPRSQILARMVLQTSSSFTVYQMSLSRVSPLGLGLLGVTATAPGNLETLNLPPKSVSMPRA